MTKMNDKVNGFILSISDYKETDSLMKVITKEYGILSFVTKSSKKMTSKNHYLPMCEYELLFDYKDNKTIFSLHNGKLLNNYFDDKDIEMMSFKNIIIEACIKNQDIPTYDELLFVFKNINKDNRFLLGSLFFSYLIKQYGIMPVVDHCSLCEDTKVVSISNAHGGFLCHKHLNGEKIIDVERLKKFRMIIKANFEHYDILKQFSFDFIDFNYVVSFFMENADLQLKSYNLYEKLI